MGLPRYDPCKIAQGGPMKRRITLGAVLLLVAVTTGASATATAAEAPTADLASISAVDGTGLTARQMAERYGCDRITGSDTAVVCKVDGWTLKMYSTRLAERELGAKLLGVQYFRGPGFLVVRG